MPAFFPQLQCYESFQVNSDLLLYSYAMELSFRSFMYTVDAEIVEITATDFISSLTAPHLQATENAFGVILLYALDKQT